MGRSGLWLGKETFSVGENAESKQFSGVAYSGGAITDRLVMSNTGDIFDKLVIDVHSASERTTKQNPSLGIPVFYNHDQNQILGNGRLAFADDIRISGKFSAYTDESKKIHGLMKDEGFPMQQSIYVETDNIEGFKTGSVNVNGRAFDAPIAVFRNGFIREVSLCPIGADPDTSAEVFSVTITSAVNAAQEKQKGEKQMNLEKFTWLNDEQKKEYTKLSEKDAFEAFQYAQKLCPCADAADAEKSKADADAAEQAAADEQKEKDEDDEEDDETKTDTENLKKKVSELSTKVESLTKENEKFANLDPRLFKKEENPVDQTKLKSVVEKAKEIMKSNPDMEYQRAYARAASEVRSA